MAAAPPLPPPHRPIWPQASPFACYAYPRHPYGPSAKCTVVDLELGEGRRGAHIAFEPKGELRRSQLKASESSSRGNGSPCPPDPATLNKGDTLQLMFCSPTDGWWEKTVQISVKMSTCKCKLITVIIKINQSLTAFTAGPHAQLHHTLSWPQCGSTLYCWPFHRC